MLKILDHVSDLKQEQLLFLQRTIDTVNSALAVQRLTTDEIQQIISKLSITDMLAEHQGVREELIDLLSDEYDAVHYLTNKLDNYQTRYLASSFLGWFGDKARIALPKLIDLASGHGPASGAAQNAVIFIGKSDEKLLYAIENALLSSDDESFRQLSTLSLKTNLGNTERFFDTLCDAATHENPDIKEVVADVIWQLPTPDKNKIKSVLVTLSSDEAPSVRAAAFSSLEALRDNNTPHSL